MSKWLSAIELENGSLKQIKTIQNIAYDGIAYVSRINFFPYYLENMFSSFWHLIK